MNRSGSDNTAFQSQFGNAISSASNVVAFPGPDHRVALAPIRRHDWSEALSNRFNELVALPKGWDGYQGRPVSFSSAKFAAQLLERLYDERVPPPSLIPGSDGSLQIEWHLNQFDVEVDVLGPYDVAASRHDCLDAQEEEIELESDFSILARWIEELALPRNEDAVAREA